MELLKSYAHQVASYHPAKDRDELFAEVYDELCEEFADWSASHPGGDEVAFLNANRQHPMRHATHLAGEHQNYLIGPQFYYSFIEALKAAAGITAGIYLAFGIVSALSSGAWVSSMLKMLFAWPHTLMWVALVILGVFVALERSGERAAWLERWKASDLKPLDSHARVSRVEAFFDIGWDVLCLLWITRLVEVPTLIWHHGEPVFGWVLNLPSVLLVIAGGLFAFDIAFSLLRLWHGFWSRRLRWTNIANNLAGIALLAWALSHRPMLSVLGPPEEDLEVLQGLVNLSLNWLLVGIGLALAWDALSHAWRLWKDHQAPRVAPGAR